MRVCSYTVLVVFMPAILRNGIAYVYTAGAKCDPKAGEYARVCVFT
jgi:hypothetical protein